MTGERGRHQRRTQQERHRPWGDADGLLTSAVKRDGDQCK
jgi:hypothetical protein